MLRQVPGKVKGNEWKSMDFVSPGAEMPLHKRVPPLPGQRNHARSIDLDQNNKRTNQNLDFFAEMEGGENMNNRGDNT